MQKQEVAYLTNEYKLVYITNGTICIQYEDQNKAYLC